MTESTELLQEIRQERIANLITAMKLAEFGVPVLTDASPEQHAKEQPCES